MTCPICGKPQSAKCEAGEVQYLSGRFPCAMRAGILPAPRDKNAELMAGYTPGPPKKWSDISDEIDDDEWTVRPDAQ